VTSVAPEPAGQVELPPSTPLRCSFAAERRGDPMPGTAAPGMGFLLIEQPGPWGRLALSQSQLDPAVGAAVSARGVAAGLRVLLIRRPGRQPADREPGTRRFAVVDSRPGFEAARWGTFVEDADLLEVPLDARAGTPSYDPIYLVCTHGRHDPCCAIRGRPVAAALAEARPEQTWECSHVGGDRFAGNLVVLPHGLYYGRVTAQNALEVVEAYERGEVVLRLLRGRTRWLPAAQAAQHRAREVYGDLSVDAFPAAGTLHLPDGRWQVRLRHGTGHLLATVVGTAEAQMGLLTCHATSPAHPPNLVVTNLVELGASS
jgi:(2Fe-2S) ferredoxin